MTTAARKGIIPGLMSLDGKETVVLDRVSELSKDLTTAQVERIGLEAQMQLINSRKYDSMPAVMGDTRVQAVQAQLNSLDGRLRQHGEKIQARLSADGAVGGQASRNCSGGSKPRFRRSSRESRALTRPRRTKKKSFRTR